MVVSGLLALLVPLIVLAVVAYVIYIVLQSFPIPAPFKTIIMAVFGLIIFLMILQVFGLYSVRL